MEIKIICVLVYASYSTPFLMFPFGKYLILYGGKNGSWGRHGLVCVFRGGCLRKYSYSWLIPSNYSLLQFIAVKVSEKSEIRKNNRRIWMWWHKFNCFPTADLWQLSKVWFFCVILLLGDFTLTACSFAMFPLTRHSCLFCSFFLLVLTLLWKEWLATFFHALWCTTQVKSLNLHSRAVYVVLFCFEEGIVFIKRL